jgi:hypothetical protein
MAEWTKEGEAHRRMDECTQIPPTHTRSVDTHSQTAGRRGWDVGKDGRVVWSGGMGRGVVGVDVLVG